MEEKQMTTIGHFFGKLANCVGTWSNYQILDSETIMILYKSDNRKAVFYREKNGRKYRLFIRKINEED